MTSGSLAFLATITTVNISIYLVAWEIARTFCNNRFLANLLGYLLNQSLDRCDFADIRAQVVLL